MTGPPNGPAPAQGPPTGPTGQGPVRVKPVVALADSGPVLPGWVLRAALALVCGALIAVLAADGAPGSYVGVLGLVALATAMSPSSAAPAAMGGAAVLGLVIVDPAGDDALRPAVLAVVFLVHLVHVGCGIAAVVPRGAVVHLSVLRRPLVRLLVIQTGVFALAGLAAVLPRWRNPALLEVAATAAITAVAVLGVLLIRRRGVRPNGS